jgi:hypothetical protein
VTGTTAQRKPAGIDRLVETKVTKSELIALVVDQATAEIRAEMERVQSELDELRSLTRDELVSLTGDAAPRKDSEDGFSMSFSNYYGSDDVSVTFRVRASNPFVRARRKKYLALTARAQKLRENLGKLTGSSADARNAILRSVLSSTPDGLEVLALVDAMKTRVVASLSAGDVARQLAASAVGTSSTR